MIEVSPLVAADVPAKVKATMDAFANHPRMPMMWPRGLTDDFWAYQEDSQHAILKDPTARMFKAVDTSTAELVGSADWTLALDPTKEPSQPAEQPPANWPKDGNWGLRRFYKVNLIRLIKLYLPGKPYIMLDYLTVRPDRQGQGIGKKLMEWGIQAADERGVMMCIESTPDGLSLYKKYGFREIETIDADMKDFGWTEAYDESEAIRVFMIRDAR